MEAEEHDPRFGKLVDKVRQRLNKRPRPMLHFRKMKHEHRLPYMDSIGKARLRTVNVLVYKPSILEPEV